MSAPSLIQQLNTHPSIQAALKALDHPLFHKVQFDNHYQRDQEHTVGFSYYWTNQDEGEDGNLVTWEEEALDDLTFQTPLPALDEHQQLHLPWCHLLVEQLKEKVQDLQEEWY